ncbi:hypothetical protein BURPS1710A_3412 [Burkholderia pseudomallei 1710a]|uniref:Uncharacterized protein n=1 Tax=Burkholderia pseudomallei 1710a TaxID=320371 RepID=A0A0E1W7W0_BURPE|nr:hypothetical protein BURPS1710A_3412 [Burkholderia pseudomallei 1710a]
MWQERDTRRAQRAATPAGLTKRGETGRRGSAWRIEGGRAARATGRL